MLDGLRLGAERGEVSWEVEHLCPKPTSPALYTPLHTTPATPAPLEAEVSDECFVTGVGREARPILFSLSTIWYRYFRAFLISICIMYILTR